MTKEFYKKNGELECGIYSYFTPKNLVYFSGDYDGDGHALFEDIDGKKFSLPDEHFRALTKLSEEEIKDKINWLEKALNSKE